MNPHETLELLKLLRGAGQSDDIDGILTSAIARIENVIDAEADVRVWAWNLQRRIVSAQSVPTFLTAA